MKYAEMTRQVIKETMGYGVEVASGEAEQEWGGTGHRRIQNEDWFDYLVCSTSSYFCSVSAEFCILFQFPQVCFLRCCTER